MSTLEKGKKLIEYMRSKDYRVLAINIVYLEDVNADTWESLEGKLDSWDDARILVRTQNMTGHLSGNFLS